VTIRDVKVHVLPTVTTPKLKLFSGLPPTSKQEATFEERRQQVVQTIDDEAISDKAAYVRRSLREAALQQVNALGSNDAMVIVKHLTTLFGVLKSPEEEYLEICQTRPKKEGPGVVRLPALDVQPHEGCARAGTV